LKLFKLFHRAGPIESVKTGSKAGHPHPSPLHLSIEREPDLEFNNSYNGILSFLL
jgi:hypothetical protein